MICQFFFYFFLDFKMNSLKDLIEIVDSISTVSSTYLDKVLVIRMLSQIKHIIQQSSEDSNSNRFK